MNDTAEVTRKKTENAIMEISDSFEVDVFKIINEAASRGETETKILFTTDDSINYIVNESGISVVKASPKVYQKIYQNRIKQMLSYLEYDSYVIQTTETGHPDFEFQIKW